MEATLTVDTNMKLGGQRHTLLRQQIYWLLTSLLLASLDLFNALHGALFVSFGERISFVLKGYGSYLACVFLLGNGISLALGGIARIFLRRRDTGGLSLTILFTLLVTAVLVHVSEAELSLARTRDVALAAVFLLLGAAAGFAVSSGMRFLVQRHSRRVAVFGFALFFVPFVYPGEAERFDVQEQALVSGRGRHPNTILIVIDALREDYLHGYNGRDLATPTFDRLASEGTRFRNVISQSSWTKASIASLMTSTYSDRYGIYSEDSVLDEDVATLPSELLAHGVTTAAFVGNPWLASLYGFDRGFAFYAEEFYHLDRLFLLDFLYRRRLLARPSYEDGGEILKRARKWIKNSAHRPFFAYIHLMDVHLPYAPPPPFDTMYLPKGIRLPDRERLLEMNEEFLSARSQPDSLTVELMRSLYLGEISYEDKLIGEFLDFLKKESLLDSSFIIVTSDHGEEFMDHGGTTHARTLYSEVLRVPLFLRYPQALPRGRVVENRVMLLDIAPTILEVHGIAKPPSFQGSSLLNAVSQASAHKSQYNSRTTLSELYYRGRAIQSVRKDGWKLILENTALHDLRSLETELYNLRKDPHERLDLARDSLAVVEKLSPLLPKVSREGGSRIELPKELKQRLEALGYVIQ